MTLERLSFLGKRLPPSFELHLIALPPGGRRAYVESEWRGALVIVEQGEIEVECLAGGCRRFERGAVIWLAGLPLRALHNRSDGLTLLAAVHRRRPLAARSNFT